MLCLWFLSFAIALESRGFQVKEEDGLRRVTQNDGMYGIKICLLGA